MTLRLVFHFSRSADGSFTGRFDSLDQDTTGITLSSVVLKDSRLTFANNSINGSFEGTLSGDGNSIEGTWTQGQSFPLALHRIVQNSLAGDWSGTLDAGEKLRLVFHISATTGGIKATLDSLDQNARGIPIAGVTQEGSTIRMDVSMVGGHFEGKLAADGNTIAGIWTQGAPLPLVLTRGTVRPAEPPKRPQNP